MSEINHRYKIARSFGSASQSYDMSARLQRYSGKHLMPWLPKKNDLTVIDLGSGTGFFTSILAGRYQQTIGLDISHQMLSFAKKNRNESIIWLEADAFNLPLKDNSVGLVYSNLMLQWCEPLNAVINETLRVLKPGGLLIFSTLADGTLNELKSSWAQVDNDHHVIDFKTTEQLNALFDTNQSHLIEHKTQELVLEYENVLHLVRELKGLGANHLPKKQNKGLAGKDKWKKMIACYQDFQEPSGIYPATYSVYSGMAVKLNE